MNIKFNKINLNLQIMYIRYKIWIDILLLTIIYLIYTTINTIQAEETTTDINEYQNREPLTDRQKYVLIALGLLACVIFIGVIQETYFPDVDVEVAPDAVENNILNGLPFKALKELLFKSQSIVKEELENIDK